MRKMFDTERIEKLSEIKTPFFYYDLNILDETLKNNQFENGDLLLFAAVGAGWTWGTALYKW